jgi:hypothetical protein
MNSPRENSGGNVLQLTTTLRECGSEARAEGGKGQAILKLGSY